MEKEAYIAALEADSAKLAAAARANLQAEVPSCPGWTVADLVAHIGLVDWHFAHALKSRAQQPEQVPKEIVEQVPGLLPFLEAQWEGSAEPRQAPAGLVEWYERGAAALAAELRTAGPDDEVYHWSGDNRVIVHARMMAIETAVHRWDVQLAQGEPEPINATLARDGIDQTLEVMMPARRSWKEPRVGDGETFHVQCTDQEGNWWVRFDGGEVRVDSTGDTAGVTARGSANDLFLFLWQRLPAEQLEVEGDVSLLDRWFALVPPV